MSVKVQTFPKPPPSRGMAEAWWNRDRPKPLAVTRIMPFAASRNGSRIHRVRCADIYSGSSVDGQRGRLCVSLWCGMSIQHPRLLETVDPVTDLPVCGTCHGRAIGAGQIDHEGTPLLFSPRTGVLSLGYCCYEVSTSAPWYGGTYYQCDRPATVPIDEVPGAGVCAKHAKVWPPRHRSKYESSLDYARAGIGEAS